MIFLVKLLLRRMYLFINQSSYTVLVYLILKIVNRSCIESNLKFLSVVITNGSIFLSGVCSEKNNT